MSVTIDSIALFLGAKKGNSSNYNLVLTLYESETFTYPYQKPVARTTRNVVDIHRNNWYSFNFDTPVLLNSGKYSITLHQENFDNFNPVDFDWNFCEWIHSNDFETSKTIYAYSTQSGFENRTYDLLTSVGYGFGEGIFTGYGYGYGKNSVISYFDIFDFDGSKNGHGLFSENYGYGYGYENDVIYDYNNKVCRAFKVYEDFNNISYFETNDCLRIEVPAAETKVIEITNRQDFIDGEKKGTNVLKNSVCLDNCGGRFYNVDAFNYSDSNTELIWNFANEGLPANDLNFGDIANLAGSTNQFRSFIAVAPYFDYLYLSSDSGNSWHKNVPKVANKNYSCVQIVSKTSDSCVAFAFDDSGDSSRGVCYKATLTASSIVNGTVTWTELGRVIKYPSTGMRVNHILYVSETFIIAATNRGLYYSANNGETWYAAFVLGDSVACNINQIIQRSPLNYILSTDNGLYYVSYEISNETFTSTKISTVSQPAYCAHILGDYIYVGTSIGLVRSISEGIYTQNNPIEDFYAVGLLKNKITSISSNGNSELYVSQYGGVFISTNSGSKFSLVSKSMSENRIKFLLNSPVNSRLLFAATETTKFSGCAVTFLIDVSGSMVANDPNNYRLTMAKKVINGLSSEYSSESYFQIVTFGSSETDFENFAKAADSDFPGASVLTSVGNNLGFVYGEANADAAIASVGESLYNRTPLFDSLDAVSEGLNRSGAAWHFDKNSSQYVFKDISTKYFSDTFKKVLIVLTDGNDTVNWKNADDLIEQYSKVRANVYVVGIGQSVSYDNLEQIKKQHNYSMLYLAPYDENIVRWGVETNFGYSYSETVGTSRKTEYLDIAEMIIERESTTKRVGTWNKIFHLNSKKKVDSILVEAVVPTNTTCTYRARSSYDKDRWFAWTDDFLPNVVNSISDMMGKYIEIELFLYSQSYAYSPIVNGITINYFEPSKSYFYFDTKTGDKDTTQFLYSSIYETNTELNHGYIPFGVKDFELSSPVYCEKRSVISSRKSEPLETEDGYFYYAQNGMWFQEESTSLPVIYCGYDVVDVNEYVLVPSTGMVVFFNNQLNKSFTISLYRNNEYTIGTEIVNYLGIPQNYDIHDVSWMYFAPKETVAYRESLPYVTSQLKDLNSCGLSLRENHVSQSGTSTKFLVQYIVKETISDGEIVIKTGQYINLGVGDLYYWKYYNQNTYLNEYTKENVRCFIASTKQNLAFEIERMAYAGVDDPQVGYQIVVNVSSKIEAGESIMVEIGVGNQFQGNLRQNNYLIGPNNIVFGEFQSSFVSQINGVITSFEPPIRTIGGDASNIVVIAPTTSSAGNMFSFSVLAVDFNGLIDRNFIGEISISFSPESFGFLNIKKYQYKETDYGSKVFNGFINGSSSGHGKIVVTVTGSSRVFCSNPINIVPSSDYIKWGDFNISTMIGVGRQNIDFVTQYAKNISQLDFIGIADDITILNDHADSQAEWDYENRQVGIQSQKGITVFNGFTHKTSDYCGERIIVFEDKDRVPDNLPSGKNQNLDDAQAQIGQLIDDLKNSPFVSIVTRPSYGDQTEIGFNFENYGKITTYDNGQSFIEDNELIAEIYSEHGFCENVESDYYCNPNNFSEQQENYIQYALQIGKKFGFVAGSGGYSSRPGYYTGEKSNKLNW